MTSLWCKQFKAPKYGHSTRFIVAQVTVDCRLVQHFHYLLMSIDLHQVNFLFMYLGLIVWVFELHDLLLSPLYSHVSTPTCIKLVVGFDLLYNIAWKGILGILDFTKIWCKIQEKAYFLAGLGFWLLPDYKTHHSEKLFSCIKKCTSKD